MKNRSHLFLILYSVPFFSFGQADIQTSILTDKGIFTVSQSAKGKDMIIVPAAVWDEMIKGTKYSFDDLPASGPKQIFIQVSNKTLQCNGGIGFCCGIWDRTTVCNIDTVTVNDHNRICAASLQKTGIGSVEIIFLDQVDWESLQTDQ